MFVTPHPFASTLPTEVKRLKPNRYASAASLAVVISTISFRTGSESVAEECHDVDVWRTNECRTMLVFV